ncbi:MAG: amidohydrolase family protein, partial [Acidaminobacteraceae bacterium]
VTCFADMYEPSDVLIDMVTEAKIRANISGPRIGQENDLDNTNYINHIKKYNDSNDGLLKEYTIIHSVYTYSEEKIKNRIAVAKEAGTGIQIHISEATFETDLMNEKYGKTTVEVLNEWGLFDVPTLAAHCVHLSDNDIKILKEKSVNVAHCPSSNLKLASGIANIPRLLKEGINVCIGTDGVSSNSNLNMIEEMHITSLIHKGHFMDPLVLNAKEVIQMATINGARALGFGDLAGSLEVGKKADLIIIDTDKAHLTPLTDVLSAIVYSMQASDVDTVMVNGTILMEGRKLLHMDEEKIKREVNARAKKILTEK